MNLKDLREYIANVIDYDPSANADYNKQVDSIINHYYRMLFSSKEFTFAQKEVKVEVYKDQTVSATATYNMSSKLTTLYATLGLPAWAEGNIVEIEGVEYDVLYNEPGNSNECFVEGNVSYTGAKSIRFKNRFIRLPVDCVALLQVGRQSMTIAPSAVGRYVPMTRFEDEYYNMPLDEVNIPNYWIIQDDFMLTAPVVPPIVAVHASTAGKGVRTVRCAQTYLKWEKNGTAGEVESGLSPFSDPIELADNQILQITYPALPNNKPYARRVYIIDDSTSPKFKGVYEINKVDPGFASTQLVEFTETEFSNGTFVLNNEQFKYPEGYRQQLRLYPRQNEDFELSVRYIYNPTQLVEDTDTPELPQSHQICLAYACLWDILNKHDNLSLGGIYKKKYMAEVIKMEQRFLTQKPRRFVKGFMKESGVDTLPMFTPLRRIP